MIDWFNATAATLVDINSPFGMLLMSVAGSALMIVAAQSYRYVRGIARFGFSTYRAYRSGRQKALYRRYLEQNELFIPQIIADATLSILFAVLFVGVSVVSEVQGLLSQALATDVLHEPRYNKWLISTTGAISIFTLSNVGFDILRLHWYLVRRRAKHLKRIRNSRDRATYVTE